MWVPIVGPDDAVGEIAGKKRIFICVKVFRYEKFVAIPRRRFGLTVNDG